MVFAQAYELQKNVERERERSKVRLDILWKGKNEQVISSRKRMKMHLNYNQKRKKSR